MTIPRIFSLFCILLVLNACSSDPLLVVEKAQQKIQSNQYISYSFTSYWPNPAGLVDTSKGQSIFLRKANDYYDYDYIGRNEVQDIAYIDNQHLRINHQDSLVYNFSAEDLEKEKRFLTENTFLLFSPLKFLENTDWQYVQDTLVGGQDLLNFSRVEMDTTIEDKHIYVENHIFLDPSKATLLEYERRAFLNGKSSQTIVHHFSDYEFAASHAPIAYELPSNYRSQIYGDREKLELLKAGVKAPNFNLQDVNGQKVSLSDLKGQKVLLDFSVINCGYCKLALEHFNQQDYQLAEDFTPIYINPEDKVEAMRNYMDKIPVPFPVVAAAKATGQAYGVSGYPTFFIIDEEGIIEKVVVGYQKAFLESLNATQM